MQLLDEDDIYPPSYKETQALIAELMGSRGKPIPDTSENVSRTRLLRVKAGLLHLLTVVIPLIENEQQRLQVYWWAEAVHNIVRFEEHDAKNEQGVCND
ncbi:transcriptional regulator [Yersinia mollaretii]|nr:transcriptional regulator [Yersinia enterocolitica]NIL03935.1 transcriptional regulator [Yersinia mollaretii]OWF77204.1 transcriptional regulator [Yersinia kristensenii]